MVQMFLVGIYGPNVVDLDPMVKISLENTPNALGMLGSKLPGSLCSKIEPHVRENRDEGS